jgi:L-asparaginase/Glu-tRNA(Gln) amidotransferase subunit D
MSQEAELDEPRLRKPIVHIVTTGGTIASRIDPATGIAFPVMHAHELLAEIPELSKYAEPRLTEFALVPSFDMTPGIVARLARDTGSLLATGEVDGVVVTHGTDTMEESALALGRDERSGACAALRNQVTYYRDRHDDLARGRRYGHGR